MCEANPTDPYVGVADARGSVLTADDDDDDDDDAVDVSAGEDTERGGGADLSLPERLDPALERFFFLPSDDDDADDGDKWDDDEGDEGGTETARRTSASSLRNVGDMGEVPWYAEISISGTSGSECSPLAREWL